MRKRQPLLFETLQNLGLFLLMLLLTGWTADWNDLRYVDVRLLYVVIVAISFGMRQGLLATVLAIASYVAALLHAQIDISYMFYSVESWIPFILYGVAGAFGGYWSDKKYDDYDSLADQYREQGERYDFLKELYREVVDVKNQLQRQIVVSRDSLGRLYSITEELQSPSPRTVCVKTIGVMEDIMECESAALYIHQDGETSAGSWPAPKAFPAPWRPRWTWKSAPSCRRPWSAGSCTSTPSWTRTIIGRFSCTSAAPGRWRPCSPP